MDLVAALRVFVRVADAGGFSAAARDLGMAQPTVSKAVAQLEEHLGVRLLHRTTQKLALTDDGRIAVGHARAIIDDVAGFEESLGRRRAAPSGLLRVAAPVAFGRLQIMPRIAALLARHPALDLELVMGDEPTDLVANAVDVAIRIGEVTQPGLVARRLGITRRVAVAARAYLEERGRPRTPGDLSEHDCIVYTHLATGNEWFFDDGGGRASVKVRGRFRSNNSEAVREAVLAGLGIAVCPIWLFRDELSDGRLDLVLERYEPVPLPIQAVWPSRRFTSGKVRAFIDHMAAEFRLDPLLSDYGVRSSG